MTHLAYAKGRAAAAHAAAESAPDPRDAAAWRAAAATWERLSQPGVAYSMAPHYLQLAALARDAGEALAPAAPTAQPAPVPRYQEIPVPVIEF